MRLIELEPRWIHPNLFVFKCPHCKGVLLTVKNIPMSDHDQYELFDKEFGTESHGWGDLIVPCKSDFSWQFSGQDFETLTVSPSVDASNSGHWHGNIVNGNIQ